MVDISKTVAKICLAIVILALTLSFIPQATRAQAPSGSISFYGPYNEATDPVSNPTWLYNADGTNATCTLTIYYRNAANQLYSTSYNLSRQVEYYYFYNFDPYTYTNVYFTFDVVDTSTDPDTSYHREYWCVEGDQYMTTFYIMFSSLQTDVAFNIFNYRTLDLSNGGYLTVRSTVGPNYFVVEQRPIDGLGDALTELELNKLYKVYVTSVASGSSYQFGDIYTVSTALTLTIPPTAFPKESLMLYEYVHAWANRTFLTPTGSIIINYEDTQEATNYVRVTITNTSNSQVAFTQLFTGALYQSFSYSWPNADNRTSYLVEVEVGHADYGVFTFKQYMLGEYTKPDAPFSLGFMGNIGIDTAWFIPCLLIIFVAGCFSELTSEAAAVITTIVAVLLAALGFLSIASASLVVAMALSIMAGIAAARRRMQYT